MTLTDNADLGIRCAGCGGNIPGMTMAAGRTYHVECTPRAPTPLEKSHDRIAQLEALLLDAVEKLEAHDAPRPSEKYPACGIRFPKITDEINHALSRGVR